MFIHYEVTETTLNRYKRQPSGVWVPLAKPFLQTVFDWTGVSIKVESSS